MGLYSYMLGKIITQPEIIQSEIVQTEHRFTILNIAVVSGSVAIVLFGLGYTLAGLGSIAKPVSDIIDELHDSSSDSSSEN